MGIFDVTTNKTEAEVAAESIKMAGSNMYWSLVREFIKTTNAFWNNSTVTPQQISDALGTNASEIFSLHYKLGEFIATVDATPIQEAMESVGQFTQNPDGTVTIEESFGSKPEKTKKKTTKKKATKRKAK